MQCCLRYTTAEVTSAAPCPLDCSTQDNYSPSAGDLAVTFGCWLAPELVGAHCVRTLLAIKMTDLTYVGMLSMSSEQVLACNGLIQQLSRLCCAAAPYETTSHTTSTYFSLTTCVSTQQPGITDSVANPPAPVRNSTSFQPSCCWRPAPRPPASSWPPAPCCRWPVPPPSPPAGRPGSCSAPPGGLSLDDLEAPATSGYRLHAGQGPGVGERSGDIQRNCDFHLKKIYRSFLSFTQPM